MKTLKQNTLGLLVGVILALFAGALAYGQNSEDLRDSATGLSISLEQVPGVPASEIYVSRTIFHQAVARVQQGSPSDVHDINYAVDVTSFSRVNLTQTLRNTANPLSRTFRFPKDYFVYTLERMLC